MSFRYARFFDFAQNDKEKMQIENALIQNQSPAFLRGFGFIDLKQINIYKS